MKSKSRIYPAIWIMALLSLSAASATASSSWVQHKVTSRQFPIRTVCIVPAEVQVEKLGLKTAEQMPKETEDWAVALQVFVESHFKTDGIQIDSATNPYASGASDADISQAIQEIQQKYDSISPLLSKKPKAIVKGAYTLSDMVATLPCAANSDIMVFIRGTGVVPSRGHAAIVAMGGGIETSRAIVDVTLADAKTGEILAMMRFSNVDDDFLASQEDAFGLPLDNELANVNIGSARKVQAAREFGPGSHQ